MYRQVHVIFITLSVEISIEAWCVIIHRQCEYTLLKICPARRSRLPINVFVYSYIPIRTYTYNTYFTYRHVPLWESRWLQDNGRQTNVLHSGRLCNLRVETDAGRVKKLILKRYSVEITLRSVRQGADGKDIALMRRRLHAEIGIRG